MIVVAALLSSSFAAGPSTDGSSLNLNAATRADLDALPMLGPAKAEALLAWRLAHGPCVALTDLAAVPGFGAATVAALSGRAVCGPVPTEQADPDAAGVVLAPVAAPRRIDVNLATVEQLMSLPGVVEARARAIVDDRDRNGPFAACADLVRVPGMGPATVANLLGSCAPP